MNGVHHYALTVEWTGNTGTGTSGYREYTRSHMIGAEGKPTLEGSSDPAFRGDPQKYNPEELLLASLSACHMLSYLHLCVNAGIVVTAYSDRPTGIMQESADGSGKFTEVMLHPEVTITDAALAGKALELHKQAHKVCFIANSVNFPVLHEASCHVRENDPE